MSSQDDPAAACPVDHKTREAWLAQARANSNQPSNPHNSTTTTTPTPSPVQQQSCDSSTLAQSTAPPSPHLSPPTLGTDRQTSTIPRALPAAPPHEKDTNPQPTNWIYPSERMFFEAMRRKAHNPDETDMKTIVPIHNAVNERAWLEIRAWETRRGADACGGPRLESFSGLSTSLSPRARWKALLGYQLPFDRHDWVVDRCGVKIEYVIDFYAGRSGGAPGKELSFYLDVRPKLNSWEGVKMRFARFWGF